MAAKQTGAVDKAQKKEVPQLDPSKVCTIVGTGTNRHLKEGTEHPAHGADAQALIEAGHATLKEAK